MKFTEDQFYSLASYEKYFETAVNESFARYPGENTLKFILSIYNDVTFESRRVNTSCQSCVLNLLRDCGKLYFADKKEREETGKKKKSNRKDGR